jgi:hypothetical protein
MSLFGCDKCWSSEAARAWETVTNVPFKEWLIDESHFIVSIRKCPCCSQLFLQITTETIDWQDGEDPIFRTVIPIDDEEQSELIGKTSLGERDLESIGVGRQSLKYDWPKGKESSTYWSAGVIVGPHD